MEHTLVVVVLVVLTALLEQLVLRELLEQTHLAFLLERLVLMDLVVQVVHQELGLLRERLVQMDFH
jgi:hypothetical protein